MMWMQKRRQFFTLLFAPVFTSFRSSKEYDTTRFLTNNLFFCDLVMSQVCVNISNLNIIWGSNNATIINIARIDTKECWILLCYLFKGISLVVENYAVILSRVLFRAYFECHTSLFDVISVLIIAIIYGIFSSLWSTFSISKKKILDQKPMQLLFLHEQKLKNLH